MPGIRASTPKLTPVEEFARLEFAEKLVTIAMDGAAPDAAHVKWLAGFFPTSLVSIGVTTPMREMACPRRLKSRS